jgi:glycosyltransferase involved in cell wall biosynthesis
LTSRQRSKLRHPETRNIHLHMPSPSTVSVVIPAKNEAASIGRVVASVRSACPEAEVIVVDDGSTDDTGRLASAAGATVLRHPYSRGNGAAVKNGARNAKGDILVFLDADGQHDPQDIPRLLETVAAGSDLVIGARQRGSQASVWRSLGNGLYNRLASWIVGQPIPDLTSGFRAARARAFREFLHLLPNGFSYPTTSTMAFYRAGYVVSHVPIQAAQREGRSHIRLLRDGTRFLVIIFRVGTLYSPLKIFGPLSASFFVLGSGYYGYTFATEGRFTNMGVLLLSMSALVFLIGLLSEQITALMYRQ